VWDAGKQVSLLLEHDHKIPVWIAGSDKHPDDVIRGVRPAHAARKNVGFCGYQAHPHLAQLLSRASIYAATSRYEPFGLAPLEAAFSRCALVANDIPPFRELWGDVALYFETNDAKSLAQAIERLRADRQLRLEYGNRAYDLARRRFTAECMVDEYVRLYQSLLPLMSSTAGIVTAGVAAL
jgi:glycosyltransferase involved in cell wall biosynthesis